MRWLENWYERNKFRIWLIGAIGAAVAIVVDLLR